MKAKMKNFIILIIFSNLAFSTLLNFIFAQSVSQNMKEVEIKITKEILINFWNNFKEKVIYLFKKLGNFLKKIWNSYIFPKLNSFWQKNINLFKKEIERRKSYIKEESEKEKKEIKEEIKIEIPKIKNIWEKIKELIK